MSISDTNYQQKDLLLDHVGINTTTSLILADPHPDDFHPLDLTNPPSNNNLVSWNPFSKIDDPHDDSASLLNKGSNNSNSLLQQMDGQPPHPPKPI